MCLTLILCYFHAHTSNVFYMAAVFFRSVSFLSLLSEFLIKQMCFYVDLACSGSFWKKMELGFASLSIEDISFLKQQVRT